mgnify:CR=1 FL=1
MDKIPYFSVECWGGATFDSCLRYLDEDPWERLRAFRKAMPNTRLQMLLRGQNLLGYKHYHDDVVEKFVELSIKNGIDVLRIFDALNDFRNIRTALEATKKYATANTVASGCISYTQSPVHTPAKYAEMCKELQTMGFDTICLKDMAGTMSPYEAEHLIKGIKDAVGDVPLILHTHCTTGMAYMTVTKAIESGIDVIDCATSCFSNGTSQPSTETMFYALGQYGIRRPVTILINVDFPSPLAPTNPICSPFNRRKDTSLKIALSPNPCVRCSTFNILILFPFVFCYNILFFFVQQLLRLFQNMEICRE